MTFSLRRLTITIIFVLIISAVTIASVFIATFDLNHFRIQISDTIGSRLSLPVNLGRAHFSIKHGPSFAFDDILIGTDSSPLHLKAEHLFFRLDVLPLLIGNFEFSEILFENPDTTLKIGQKSSTTGRARRLFFDQSLFEGDLIRSIRIKNGHFRIEDYRRSDKPFILALEKVRLVIDDLSLHHSGKIDIRADINCNQVRSPFRLNGYIRAGDSAPFWNQANYDLEMRVTNFASDILSTHYQKVISRFQFQGRTDIQLKLDGSPSTGLNFNASLSGRDLGLILPESKNPILAETIVAAGTWQNTGKFHKLENLALKFGPMDFRAKVNLDLAPADPILQATIEAPRLALSHLNRFTEQIEKRIDRPANFTAGTLSLKKLELAGPISSLTGPGALLAVQNLDLEIQQGAFSFDEKIRIQNIELDLELAGETLQLRKLQLDLGTKRLESNAEFQIQKHPIKDQITFSGKNHLSFRNKNLSATTDNNDSTGKGFDSTFHLNAAYKNNIWTLKNNLLILSSNQLTVQGEWDRTNDGAYSFAIDVPAFDLNDLLLLSPATRVMKPTGTVSGQLHIKGNKNSPATLTGAMAVNNGRINVPGLRADLNRLNGLFDFDWPYLHGENLNARLGESPIRLGLEIPDLTRLLINLEIQGDSIRSDELIFRSEKAFLREVDARVSITGKGVILGPIHTRMDGGTDVTIDGIVDNFPTADTRLNITGRYGNIDEVVGLWISDQDREGKKRRKRKQGLLEIDIKADAGEIINLPFEDCEGHISFRNETLIVHPITFKSGPGFGIGQVLVRFRESQAPLLQISGHLENFEALSIYQQLLQRKGLITGRLRGDFYLEGTAGHLHDVFLPSSIGSFSFEVKDGVLKKLSGLSKALTLFNIYPIFTSSGSEQGVPFKKLGGSAFLENGMLRSDDILMSGDVMNISVVGSQNLLANTVDAQMGIMPLRTIDRLITKIPIAGWILAGEEKALVTAHFELTGPANDPEITAIPIESTSKGILGIFKRLFTLPVKIISDVGKIIE